jgi:guanylate kinase
MFALADRKKVYIINGKAGVGKDKFIKYVSKYAYVVNFSSVQALKDIATKYFGYNDNIKSDKDRKFLADLKALTTEYCNFSFNSVIEAYKTFKNISYTEIMFIHCREPEEIKKLQDEIPEAETLLIVADRRVTKTVDNNHADKDINDYKYDIIINNDGSLEALDDIAEDFVNHLRITDFEMEYGKD